MTQEHVILQKITLRLVVLASCVTMLSGLISWQYGESRTLGAALALVGLAVVLVFVAGVLGALVGMVGRYIWTLVKNKDRSLMETPDLNSAVALGCLAGGFMGLVLVLLAFPWSWAVWFTCGGAGLGSALAVALGDTVAVLLRMAARDQARSGDILDPGDE